MRWHLLQQLQRLCPLLQDVGKVVATPGRPPRTRAASPRWPSRCAAGSASRRAAGQLDAVNMECEALAADPGRSEERVQMEQAFTEEVEALVAETEASRAAQTEVAEKVGASAASVSCWRCAVAAVARSRRVDMWAKGD